MTTKDTTVKHNENESKRKQKKNSRNNAWKKNEIMMLCIIESKRKKKELDWKIVVRWVLSTWFIAYFYGLFLNDFSLLCAALFPIRVWGLIVRKHSDDVAADLIDCELWNAIWSEMNFWDANFEGSGSAASVYDIGLSLFVGQFADRR